MARLYEKTVPVPPEEFVRVEWESLRSYVADVLKAYNVPEEHSKIVADVLVSADLMGIESHGVQRLRRYTVGIQVGSVNPKTSISIVKESPSTAWIDGGSGLGHVVAYNAMEIAIKKAMDTGVSVVGIRNSHHFGIAGYYALQAVKSNMIGLVMTNSEALVAYTHTVGRNVGTNPIAFGFPTRNPPPILFDAATSVIPIGKVEVYAKEGKKMPLGWAISPEGRLLDDPKEVLARKGAVLPLGGFGEEFGGHKGAGLALVVDLLCGVLTGANYGRNVKHTTDKERANVGHFMMAINIDKLTSLDYFLQRVEEYKGYVKSLSKISEDAEIWIPGEKAWLTMETRKKIGIPVHKNILKEIMEEGEKVGVEFKVKVLKDTA
ncbi:MAG: Ldh family oxidoreductase [Candidatus Bathyarchaeia archaeon]|nr:Ldh family oxidoreductase [Candidatus Bathyarchaeota archaeon]